MIAHGRRAGKVSEAQQQWARELEVVCVAATEQLCGVLVEVGTGWRSARVDASVPLGEVHEVVR